MLTQPILLDEDGVPRFKGNKIVRFLLDAGPFDMNQLRTMPWSKEDYSEFCQLIGYSVCGFGELSTSIQEDIEAADEMADELLKEKSS